MIAARWGQSRPLIKRDRFPRWVGRMNFCTGFAVRLGLRRGYLGLL